MPIHDWTRVSFGAFHNFHPCLPTKTAYVEPAAVGDPLPDMPLFLSGDWHVQTPLDETYPTAWEITPLPIKRLFDGPPP